MRPSVSRKLGRSAASSSAISASIAAQIGTTGAPLGRRARALSATKCGSPSTLASCCFVDVGDVEDRLRREQLQSRSSSRCSSARGPGRARGLPSSSVLRARSQHRRASSFSSLVAAPWPPLRASRRFSTVSRSLRQSSVSIVAMSRDRVDRSVDVDDVRSSKQRTTCTIASTSRMLARNWLPRPSPLRRAAHQAGDVDEVDRGGDLLSGWTSATSASSRSSGTGRRRRSARSCRTDSSPPRRLARDSALKSVDLPTLGRPTMPQDNAMEGPVYATGVGRTGLSQLISRFCRKAGKRSAGRR